MFSVRSKTALFTYSLIAMTVILWSLTTDNRSIWNIEHFYFSKTFIFTALAFLCIQLLVFLWRFVLCLKYSPVPLCKERDLPKCTVIIPAYNEGRQVFDTIQSVVASDYPAEKMSIIAVDDGSMDDTWHWLQRALRQFPDQIRLFRQPENRGKRHALFLGFTHGEGDIFVTIDSDSTVTPDTLRHLMAPFADSPRVGAVAGNVRILNRKCGAIPKMLEVAFAFSFDFLRAGQSVINSVMCTPGALSAYRRKAVQHVLFEWVNQKFFGRAANIGEDRAMTNLILRSGYHVQYQRDAVVYTISPKTVSKLWKMLLRWARSNIRETLVISRFVFGRFRQDGSIGLRINVLIGWLNLTLGQTVRLAAMVLLFCIPVSVGPEIILGAALASCVPGIFYALRYNSNHAVWAIPYSFFWIACLSWISLYALITPHRNGWMTRDIVSRELGAYPLETAPLFETTQRHESMGV